MNAFIARLRSDYALASVVFIGGVALLVISPFALYRFWQGHWLLGLIDTVIACAILAPVVYACRTGHTKRAVQSILIVGMLGSVAVAHLIGIAGYFWVYGYLVMAFALAPMRLALLCGWATVLGAYFFGIGLDTAATSVGFLATALLVTFLSSLNAFQVRKQREALEAAASTDPLTGAGNRRRMGVELEQIAAIAARGGSLPGLMVLDLDRFKRINDSFGHEAGDRVLTDFAEIVRLAVRKSDRLYRMGGEEFLLLLPTIEPSGLAVVANKLCRRVAERLRSPAGPVTVSIGATTHQRGELVSEWLVRADQAVYQAKAEGRDRVVLIEPPGAESATEDAPGIRSELGL